MKSIILFLGFILSITFDVFSQNEDKFYIEGEVLNMNNTLLVVYICSYLL